MRTGLIAATLVLASLPIRLVNVRAPLLGHHAFRQAQTAISVWSMQDEGLRLLDYRTPIFGPPWMVPFELPLFQISAALLARATGADVDLACRVTHLLYFYASALLLWLVCRRVLGEASACLGLGVYLFSPLTIFWSRAALIEFAAVAYGLAALLAALWFLERPHAATFLVALVAGAALWSTKLTTGVAFLPPMVAIALMAAGGRARAATVVLLAVLALAPAGVGWAWTRHADGVRASSPYTAPFASAAVRDHVIGTLGERFQPSSWRSIADMAGSASLPGLAIVLPLLGLSRARRLEARGRLLLGSMAAGILLPVLLFFHLYSRHDYYQCALVAWLAVLAGAGLEELAHVLRGRRAWWLAAIAGLGASLVTARPYWDDLVSIRADHPMAIVGSTLQRMTLPTDAVVVADQSWSPVLLHQARRRGFMLYRFEGDACNDFLRRSGFATVVCRQDHPKLFSAWSHRRLVTSVAGFQIYFVGDDEAALERRVRAAVTGHAGP